MRTVNISLTDYQTKTVDETVNKLGFANRSEFFRALLRTFFNQLETLLTEKDWPMKAPDTRSAREVLESFKKTGKYSGAFLKDLKDGLKRSSYFQNDLNE